MFKKILLFLLFITLIITPTQANMWPNKPPINSQINWGHPLARGLVGVWLMNEGGGLVANSLIPGQPAILGGNARMKLEGAYFDGSANTRAVLNNTFPLIDAQPKLSVVVSAKYNTLTTSRALIGRTNGSTAFSWQMRTDNTTASELRFYYKDASTRIWSSGAGILQGVRYLFIAVAGDGTANNGSLYLNGKKLVLNASSNILGTPASQPTYKTYIANDTFGATYTACDIYFIYIYNRVLSPSEIQHLYQEPYCFIEQPKSWWNVVTGAVRRIFLIN